MSKFKEITRVGKMQKLIKKTQELFASSRLAIGKQISIIDNNSLSYNLMEPYVFLFFANICNKLCCKRLYYVKDLEVNFFCQRSSLYLLPKFHEVGFSIVEMDFLK
jgi:hypothetical protein